MIPIDERLYVLRQDAQKRGEPILRDKSFELLLKKVKEVNPKYILEVGTNEGLSGVAMLLACETARLTGIEIDENKYNVAKKNYKLFCVSDRAKIFLGDASEIIPVLTGNYDFIFLDGPKGHYFEYCAYLLPLLNKGGILFADDVYFHGMIKGDAPHKHATIKNSMEKFLKVITEDGRLHTNIYDIEDGISVTQRIEL